MKKFNSPSYHVAAIVEPQEHRMVKAVVSTWIDFLAFQLILMIGGSSYRD